MENSNCDIDISMHALWKHDPDTFRYVVVGIGIVFEMLRESIGEIFENGKTQPVSARWREVEKERRSTIVKYLNKMLPIRIGVNSHNKVTRSRLGNHNTKRDVGCDQRTRQSSSSA